MVLVMSSEFNKKVAKFTTIYILRSDKLRLDDLKLHRDTYGDVIRRLINRCDFNIINGQIVTKDMYDSDNGDLQAK